MNNGLNLYLTESLAIFDSILIEAINEVISKKLSVAQVLYEMNIRKFQVGEYIEIIDEDDDGSSTTIWIGYGWEEKVRGKSSIWIEFDASTCQNNYLDKIYQLVGTSGKYYNEIGFEFIQKRMNAWAYCFLRKEYLSQFYDEKIDINTQKKILTEFISELLELL